jgi:hypothetical protein
MERKAFRGLGGGSVFFAKDTHYLGGWSGHTKTYTGKLKKSLQLDKKGISLRGLTIIFTIPWDEIVDLEVEGAEQATRRVTAGRLALLGPLALIAKKTKKDSTLIVTTADGDQALFHPAEFTAPELRAKLLPVILQVQKAQA